MTNSIEEQMPLESGLLPGDEPAGESAAESQEVDNTKAAAELMEYFGSIVQECMSHECSELRMTGEGMRNSATGVVDVQIIRVAAYIPLTPAGRLEVKKIVEREQQPSKLIVPPGMAV